MSSNLDSVDRQIVCMLQRDGRTSNVEIARRIGVSEATVRKRLDRLVADGVIRIVALPDPARVGLDTVTFITLDVDLSYLDRIAGQLGRCPQVRAIYYTTGENDLVVEAWFHSSQELLSFLTQELAAIPGIRQVATSHMLRTLRDPADWVLPPDRAPRIMVVDDDPDFVEIARIILVADGYEVTAARAGQEALAIMRVSRPDLVVLDVMMQGALDGACTAREMRADAQLRGVPILMVSSIGRAGFAGALPEMGELAADNYLVKPVDANVLVSEVRRLLSAPRV
ncbi:MAG TPA: response regulator [Anaerolineae bacterium]|nr:response regulator [Anaerolineae bacterium]